ncbi:MAG: 4Fe-4S binding protein [Promethearchaeota archaeon]
MKLQQNSSMENQLDYSKYFLQFDNALLVGFLILGVVVIGLTAFLLIRQRKLTIKKKIILLSISVVYGGFILGGFPNVVFLAGMTFLLLGLSLIFSRIFCGYVCPLGATQELLSMIRFKPELDYDRELVKSRKMIRWILFIVFFVFIFVFIFTFGINIEYFINPVYGFLIFWYPTNLLLLIPLSLLIIVMIASIFVYRPFCRYICPFGALASVVGRFSPFKIRRSEACLNCRLCEKICPTLEGFKESHKGECYLCYRCVEFCKNEMFIDTQKLAQIKRLLTTYSMNHDEISSANYFDIIMKNMIRLFIPYKRMETFDEFIDALEAKKDFSVEAVQSIIVRLRELFADDIKTLDRKKYKDWINQNESKWKKKVDSFQKDKLYYCLVKKSI